jgi:tetratricopeptide (TPR) repeat protein
MALRYRWVLVLALLGLLFALPMVTRVTQGRSEAAEKRVAPKDATNALSRDIAAAIRATQATGDIVLLASPNSSTAVGYYGRFKTLGTLYWENGEGLKAAAQILSASSPTEAAVLIRRYHVTHIAMISEENFIGPYCQLLHPEATEADLKKTFGYRLLVDRIVPVWLQMIPYKVPDDLATLKTNVYLYKVAFGQSLVDARYHIALTKAALGEFDAAERDFDEISKQSPTSPEPWLRKAELLMIRHSWSAAADALINGVTRAPETEQMALFGSAAGNFYRQHQPGQAIRIYRAALAKKFNPEIACYLAFVLSTCADDTLRNGEEALSLAKRALETSPDSSTFLNVLGTANAELGHYSQAIEAADRALANARISGDVAAQRVSEQRLAAFKAGKPWRE